MENNITVNGVETTFDFKKPTQKELFELDKYYRQIFGECVKLGLMTENQAARLFKKNGSWGEDQEKELSRLALKLNSLSTKIKDFDEFNEDSREVMADMFKTRADLTSLIGEKLELFRQTVEGTASEERMFLYIRLTTIDDKSNPLFNCNEDLENFSVDNPGDFGKVLTSAHLLQQGFDKDKDVTDDWEEIAFLNRAEKIEKAKVEEEAKKTKKPVAKKISVKRKSPTKK